MGSYIPQNVTGKTFDEIHPPGGDAVVHIGDLVTIPDGPKGVWEVTEFHGDFARLQDPNTGKLQAWRKGKLKPVVTE